MYALSRYISVMTVLALSFSGQAQNLVPNPDFEQYDYCPTYFSQANAATSWGQPVGQAGTCDYFNTCAAPGSLVSVPSNMCGNVPAQSGNGYMGMIVGKQGYGGDYREYIQAQLSTPMEAGKEYQFCIKWRRASRSCCAISRLGVAFTSSPPTAQPQAWGCGTLNATPQFETPYGTYLTDTTQWHSLTGVFTAVGGEQYITIGNFHDTINTQFVRVGSNDPYMEGYAYYLIDNIRLDTCPGGTTGGTQNPNAIADPNDPDFEPFIPNVFTPNGDSLNDQFMITNPSTGEVVEGELQIFNRWGQQVHSTAGPMRWDGGKYSEGTYYFLAYMGIGRKQFKGVVTLLR